MTVIEYRTTAEAFGITAEGHADYAEKGKDIVCAAVSTLLQTLLFRVADLTTCYKYSIGDGHLYVSARGPEVMYAFETIRVGLEIIARTYPDYVKLSSGGCPIIEKSDMSESNT